ncbi:MAG: phage tail tube protein [Candidatus Bathyarchaeia archaeon]
MSNTRAGFEVAEAMYIAESTYGATPTSGEWKNISLVTSLTPRSIQTRRDKIGIGHQQPSAFILTKKHAECNLEHTLLKKTVTPPWEWTDFYTYIIGSGLSLANRVDSFSLGFKLDLATDEFGKIAGCKIREYEISGTLGEEIKGRVAILGQAYSYDNSDYVSGTATRQSPPTTDPITFADVDVAYGSTPTSITGRVNSFSFTLSRELKFLGSDTTTKTLYRRLEEQSRDITAEVTLDFDSTSELNDFLSDTSFTLRFDLPSGSGGRRVDLTGGKWLNVDQVFREVDLVALRLKARFTGMSVSVIS